MFLIKSSFFSFVREKVKHIKNIFIDVLVPYSCINCGSLECSQVAIVNQGVNTIGKFFCKNCQQKVQRINQCECCQKCGYPMQKENFLDKKKKCYSCELLHPKFDVARSCFKYKGIIRRILLMLKYHFSTDALSFIGESMYNTYLENVKRNIFSKPDVICFVPITKDKLLQKSFNHSAIITNAFLKVLKDNIKNLDNCFVLYDFLVKTQKTKQAKLLKQNDRIIKQHYFEVNKKYLTKNYKTAFSNKTILVIDDIMTTGGTLNEIAILLKNTFPKCKVECLTFARTILY